MKIKYVYFLFRFNSDFGFFLKPWRNRLCIWTISQERVDLECNFWSSLPLNPFPNKPWFLRACSTSLLKTRWEKEKLLTTSNFSFSHSVFYLLWELSAFFIKFEIVVCKLFEFGTVWNLLFGKGLNSLLLERSDDLSNKYVNCHCDSTEESSETCHSFNLTMKINQSKSIN